MFSSSLKLRWSCSVGWGDVDPSDYGQKTSDELRQTNVWYLTNGKCEQSQGYVKTNDGVLFGSYQGSILNSMLCAHDRIGTVRFLKCFTLCSFAFCLTFVKLLGRLKTSDACQGDSGENNCQSGAQDSF